MRVLRHVLDDCGDRKVVLIVECEYFTDNVGIAEILDRLRRGEQDVGRDIERAFVTADIGEVEYLQQLRVGELDRLIELVVVTGNEKLVPQGAGYRFDIT